MKIPSQLPFPYLGHGIGYNRKCLECYLWFKTKISEEDRVKIETMVPKPLSCFFHWEEQFVHFGSDDTLEYYIRETYNTQIKKIMNSGDDALINQFFDDVDAGKYGDAMEPSQEE